MPTPTRVLLRRQWPESQPAWAELSLKAALAGFPRAPRAHIRPASPNHPRDDPRRADRARGAPYFTGKLMDASRWHRRPAQRSATVARATLRRGGGAAGGAAAQQPAAQDAASPARRPRFAGGEAGRAACFFFFAAFFAGRAAAPARPAAAPPAYPARLPLRANYGCAPTTDARFLQECWLNKDCARGTQGRRLLHDQIILRWRTSVSSST